MGSMPRFFMVAFSCLLSELTNAHAAKPFQGITEPYQSSTLSATVAGRVAKINVAEGYSVKKGEVILFLEKEEEEYELARRDIIFKSKAELNSAELQRDVLKKDFEATSQLFKATQSVSEEELWKKELEYKKAESEFERLTQQEQREEIECKIASVQLRNREILAPFSGVVVKINRRVGEGVNALEPLVRLVDVKKCRFVTYVESKVSSNLKRDMPVDLRIDGFKGQLDRKGIIEFISPVADPSSGLREVHVVFANDDETVKPGVSGTMSVGGDS